MKSGNLIKSFGYALNGLVILISQERNARIHLLAAAGVLLAAWLFDITAMEWAAVVFAIGLVLAAELFNTAIEGIADFVHPTHHDAIRKIKDLSAAAVLVCSIVALIAGIVVFLPYAVAFLQWCNC